MTMRCLKSSEDRFSTFNRFLTSRTLPKSISTSTHASGAYVLSEMFCATYHVQQALLLGSQEYCQNLFSQTSLFLRKRANVSSFSYSSCGTFFSFFASLREGSQRYSGGLTHYGRNYLIHDNSPPFRPQSVTYQSGACHVLNCHTHITHIPTEEGKNRAHCWSTWCSNMSRSTTCGHLNKRSTLHSWSIRQASNLWTFRQVLSDRLRLSHNTTILACKIWGHPVTL